MQNAHDVAAYILTRLGPIPAMRLQKLVYYSQYWSLSWEQRPLFHESIEMSLIGPVVSDLREKLPELLEEIKEWPLGDESKLDQYARETVDVVISLHCTPFLRSE